MVGMMYIRLGTTESCNEIEAVNFLIDYVFDEFIFTGGRIGDDIFMKITFLTALLIGLDLLRRAADVLYVSVAGDISMMKGMER